MICEKTWSLGDGAYFPYILSMAVAYLCVSAVQHFFNDPHGDINASNLPVPVSFNTAVCKVIIV